MNKEQLDEIALRVFKLNDDRMFCDTDKWVTTFTHALLAELAKVQEPIYLFRRKGFTDFYTCGYERLKTLSNEPKLFEVKIVYEHPLPPPDLVAEIERLKADNSKLQNAYNIRDDEVTGFIGIEKELRRQLIAAQEDRDLWVCLHADQVFKTNDEIYIAEGIREQLSAAQAREAELLKALEKIVEDSKDTRLSSMPHLGRTASKAIYSHKERKEGK